MPAKDAWSTAGPWDSHARRLRRLRFERHSGLKRNSGIRIVLRATRSSGTTQRSISKGFKSLTVNYGNIAKTRTVRLLKAQSPKRLSRRKSPSYSSAGHVDVTPHPIFLCAHRKSSLICCTRRRGFWGSWTCRGADHVAGKLSQYILLTSDRTFVRDSLNIVSIIWHTDLGKINLVDLHRDGKPDVWQRIVEYVSGTEKRYSLQIYRSNGSHFYSITGQADDSVKKVIYNFLLQKKSKPLS